MCTSAIDLTKKANKKTSYRYLGISAFCLLFGLIYELFSNEVYSIFMMGAFVFPLVGGWLPFFGLSFTRLENAPSLYSRYLYHAGIATLTLGSIVQGVLDIYGTTNHLQLVYWYVGAVFVGAGITAFAVDLLIKKKQ